MPLSLSDTDTIVVPGTDTIVGQPVNDCFGTKTAAAGTAFTRLAPPKSGARTITGTFTYDCGATAHTVTFMTAQDKTTVGSEAASGQAVVAVSGGLVGADGGVITANDYVVVQYEDGSWGELIVSSVSGLNLTMTASLTKKITKGTKIFMMGVASDHTDRQWIMKASTQYTYPGGDTRARSATSALPEQPILVHSNNSTAQGYLTCLSVWYE